MYECEYKCECDCTFRGLLNRQAPPPLFRKLWYSSTLQSENLLGRQKLFNTTAAYYAVTVVTVQTASSDNTGGGGERGLLLPKKHITGQNT